MTKVSNIKNKRRPEKAASLTDAFAEKKKNNDFMKRFENRGARKAEKEAMAAIKDGKK